LKSFGNIDLVLAETNLWHKLLLDISNSHQSHPQTIWSVEVGRCIHYSLDLIATFLSLGMICK
jgi:hypothetical protein